MKRRYVSIIVALAMLLSVVTIPSVIHAAYDETYFTVTKSVANSTDVTITVKANTDAAIGTMVTIKDVPTEKFKPTGASGEFEAYTTFSAIGETQTFNYTLELIPNMSWGGNDMETTGVGGGVFIDGTKRADMPSAKASITYLNIPRAKNLTGYLGNYVDLTDFIEIDDLKGTNNSDVKITYTVNVAGSDLCYYTIEKGNTSSAGVWSGTTNYALTTSSVIAVKASCEVVADSSNKNTCPSEYYYIYPAVPKFSNLVLAATDGAVAEDVDVTLADYVSKKAFEYEWTNALGATLPSVGAPDFELLYDIDKDSIPNDGFFSTPLKVYHTRTQDPSFNVEAVQISLAGLKLEVPETSWTVEKAVEGHPHDFTLDIDFTIHSTEGAFVIVDPDGGSLTTACTSDVAVYGNTPWTYLHTGGAIETYTKPIKFKSPADRFILETPVRSGYEFVRWEVTPCVSNGDPDPTQDGNHELYIKAIWEPDYYGGTLVPNTPNFEGPDGVPDRFEFFAVYKIVNGKWGDGTSTEKSEVVVLTSDGAWSIVNNDNAHLAHIPTGMHPNPGYMSGEWDVNPNTYVIELSNIPTAPAIYTYTCPEQPYIPPTPPTPPRDRDREYTLTYDSRGGTPFDDEVYLSGTKVELVNLPRKIGYTFTGWFLDQDCKQSATSVVMKSDKTVYAGWKITPVPEKLNGDDHFAYIIGLPDGNSAPLNNITRSEVATILFRLLKDEVRDSVYTREHSFKDVEDSSWYRVAVATMSKMGIINGRGDGTFDGEASITRAEFAQMFANFDKDKQRPVVSESFFTDIKGHWAEDAINYAASVGWVTGLPDGSFAPDAYISRAESMTLINRVLNRLPESEKDLLPDMITWPDNMPGEWYYLAIQEATNSHECKKKRDELYETWTKITPPRDWANAYQ